MTERADLEVKRLQDSYEAACARLEDSQDEAKAASEQARPWLVFIVRGHRGCLWAVGLMCGGHCSSAQ